MAIKMLETKSDWSKLVAGDVRFHVLSEETSDNICIAGEMVDLIRCVGKAKYAGMSEYQQG